MCGSGAGTFLIGQLLAFLLEKYSGDWRFILKIFAALFLLGFPIAITYKPLKPKKIRVTDKKLLFEESDSESSQITVNFTRSRIPTLSNILSVYSLSEDRSLDSGQPSKN